jgi:hypothetical protein
MHLWSVLQVAVCHTFHTSIGSGQRAEAQCSAGTATLEVDTPHTRTLQAYLSSQFA